MKRLIYISILATIFTSCNQTDKFKVSGTLADLKGEMLYLEQTTLTQITILDSVKLGDHGHYNFSVARPAYPEFYRLRIKNNSIIFTADSCEHIEINSQKKNFSTEYTVEQSLNTVQIQKLRNSGFEIQKALTETPVDREKVQQMISAHKEMATQIILSDTKTTASYYAVNQMIDGFYIFSPYDNSDLKFWGAVATAYQVYYTDSERSKYLSNTVLTAMSAKKRAENKVDIETILNGERTGFIDVELPNRIGKIEKLSSQKGNIILLVFSAYSLESSSTYTLFLRDLYSQYHERGFEIYHISLDENKLLWMEQSRQVPWISVRDERAPQCNYLLTFNVKQLPTHFLIGRDGDIIGRNYTLEELQRAIEKQIVR